MTRAAALLLVLAAALAACRAPERIGTVGFSGTEQEGARWFLREGDLERPLPAPPVALFPVTLLPSPNGRHLAVVSVGEGHPVLDILDATRAAAGTHGDRSLLFVDPYPGTIELVGWRGGRLLVRSDRPLADGLDASGRAPGGDVAASTSLFGIDAATGEIRPE